MAREAGIGEGAESSYCPTLLIPYRLRREEGRLSLFLLPPRPKPGPSAGSPCTFDRLGTLLCERRPHPSFFPGRLPSLRHRHPPPTHTHTFSFLPSSSPMPGLGPSLLGATRGGGASPGATGRSKVLLVRSGPPPCARTPPVFQPHHNPTSLVSAPRKRQTFLLQLLGEEGGGCFLLPCPTSKTAPCCWGGKCGFPDLGAH